VNSQKKEELELELGHMLMETYDEAIREQGIEVNLLYSRELYYDNPSQDVE
jgi:hypothetical protein